MILNVAMAHLFEQMYIDEVDFEETLTHDRLINLIFTEYVHRQIQQLEELESCVKMDTVTREPCEISETDGNQWTAMREHCEITDEGERWMIYANQAISMIDREDIWRGIVEACKILKYPEPSIAYRCYFDTLFNMSWLVWSKMYSETERTISINNLMDYILCVCKLKSQSNV